LLYENLYLNDTNPGEHKEYKIVAIYGSPEKEGNSRSFFYVLYNVLYIYCICNFVFNNMESQDDILKNEKAIDTLYKLCREKAFIN